MSNAKSNRRRSRPEQSLLRQDSRPIIFLQNAWFLPETVDYLKNKSEKVFEYLWRYALAKSRSGKRLSLMVGDLSEILIANASPEVGCCSSSRFPADLDHISKTLQKHKPTQVISCGEVASQAVRGLWTGDLLEVPHPASRVLTNELYLLAGSFVGRPGRWRFEQLRGSVKRQKVS